MSQGFLLSCNTEIRLPCLAEHCAALCMFPVASHVPAVYFWKNNQIYEATSSVSLGFPTNWHSPLSALSWRPLLHSIIESWSWVDFLQPLTCCTAKSLFKFNTSMNFSKPGHLEQDLLSAHGRGGGMRKSSRFLPTQTILCFMCQNPPQITE